MEKFILDYYGLKDLGSLWFFEEVLKNKEKLVNHSCVDLKRKDVKIGEFISEINTHKILYSLFKAKNDIEELDNKDIKLQEIEIEIETILLSSKNDKFESNKIAEIILENVNYFSKYTNPDFENILLSVLDKIVLVNSQKTIKKYKDEFIQLINWIVDFRSPTYILRNCKSIINCGLEKEALFTKILNKLESENFIQKYNPVDVVRFIKKLQSISSDKKFSKNKLIECFNAWYDNETAAVVSIICREVKKIFSSEAIMNDDEFILAFKNFESKKNTNDGSFKVINFNSLWAENQIKNRLEIDGQIKNSIHQNENLFFVNDTNYKTLNFLHMAITDPTDNSKNTFIVWFMREEYNALFHSAFFYFFETLVDVVEQRMVEFEINYYKNYDKFLKQLYLIEHLTDSKNEDIILMNSYLKDIFENFQLNTSNNSSSEYQANMFRTITLIEKLISVVYLKITNNTALTHKTKISKLFAVPDKSNQKTIKWNKLYPILTDKTAELIYFVLYASEDVGGLEIRNKVMHGNSSLLVYSSAFYSKMLLVIALALIEEINFNLFLKFDNK